MDDVQIRDYIDQDYSQIINFLFDFQNFIGVIGKKSGKKAFKTKEEAGKYLNQALKDVDEMNGFFSVAEYSNKLIGFIYGVVVENKEIVFHNLTHNPGKDGWIGIVFVDENHRTIGLGKHLVSEAKKSFIKKGCTSVRLIVDSENQNAINFYNKLGFIEYEKKMLVQI